MNWLTIFQWLIFVGLLCTAIGGIGVYLSNPPNITKQDVKEVVSEELKEIKPLTVDDISDVIAEQISNLSKTFTQPNVEITEKYPGYSMHFLISIYEIESADRKYIFDLGRPDNEGISAYIDTSNNFTFSVRDSRGEIHPIRVPIGENGIPTNKFIYLACEIGNKADSSFIQLIVNADVVGSLELPFTLNFEESELTSGVIGANYDGKLGAKFGVAEMVFNSSTLTTSEYQKMLEYFSNIHLTSYVLFEENHWMYFGSREGSQVKGDSNAKPQVYGG